MPDKCWEPHKVIAKRGEASFVDYISEDTGLTRVNGTPIAEVLRERPGYEVMTVDEWRDAAATAQNAEIAWVQITQERYEDYRDCVPPAVMRASGFLVGEPFDHCVRTGRARYTACKEVGDKFYASSRPVTAVEFREMTL